MENSKTIVLVAAAFFLGLMTGILGPRMFGQKPSVQQVSRPAPVPQSQPAGPDYSVQINELKKRLRSNPNDFGLLVQLGNTYFDSNMYLEAIEAYEKALALKPGDPNVLTDLGVMYRRSGNPAEAIKRFRMAAEADANHPQSRMNLGVVLFFDMNDPEAAREAVEDFLRVAPEGPGARQGRQLMVEIEKALGR